MNIKKKNPQEAAREDFNDVEVFLNRKDNQFYYLDRYRQPVRLVPESSESENSPLPELKETVRYVTANNLKGLTTWFGVELTELEDPENNYPYDIDVLIEYTWDTADFDLNGTQAIIGTGSGTVHVVPDTFFTQNYGGVYGVRLPIGPFGTPEYVGVGADTNVYFRISPAPSWLNGNGSLKIITTYRERTYGN